MDQTRGPAPYDVSLADSLRAQLLQDLGPSEQSGDPHFYSSGSMGRFLVAREHDLDRAARLGFAARAWRRKRTVPSLSGLLPSGDKSFLYKEMETGKMYVAGSDAAGRPIVLFDNTVQNTGNDLHSQMRLMGWTFTLAERLMPPHISKWVVFINLSNFSMSNNPPWATTRETVETLTVAYPERLGLCVLFGAPRVFGMLMSLVMPLLDAKTAAKVYMAAGDVSRGSSHDVRLTELLGEGWRKTTNVDEPYKADGKSSNGFAGRHDFYWEQCLDIERRPLVRRSFMANSGDGAPAMLLATLADSSPSQSPSDAAKNGAKADNSNSSSNNNNSDGGNAAAASAEDETKKKKKKKISSKIKNIFGKMFNKKKGTSDVGTSEEKVGSYSGMPQSPYSDPYAKAIAEKPAAAAASVPDWPSQAPSPSPPPPPTRRLSSPLLSSLSPSINRPKHLMLPPLLSEPAVDKPSARSRSALWLKTLSGSRWLGLGLLVLLVALLFASKGCVCTMKEIQEAALASPFVTMILSDRF